MTAVSPVTIAQANTALAIEGTSFGSDANDITVMVGDQSCDVDSASTTAIACTVANAVAGSQQVKQSQMNLSQFHCLKSSIVLDIQVSALYNDIYRHALVI